MQTPPLSTILITGASSGIGEALALAYAAEARTLYLTGRAEDRLNLIAEACRHKGAAVETAVVDVRDLDAMTAVLESWDDKNPVDLVIANAGISGGSGRAAREAAAPVRDIFDTNVTGMLNTIHPLIPRMTARKRGQIALMSSMAGFRGMPNAPAYSASKVAVRAYGEALRPLLRKQGVIVSTIFPGFVKTPLTDANRFKMPFMMDAEKAARYIKNGLAAGKRHIAFPLRMLLLSRLVASLPLCIGDWILMKAPKK